MLSTEVHIVQEHYFVCSEKPSVTVKPAAGTAADAAAAAMFAAAMIAAAAIVIIVAGPVIATAAAGDAAVNTAIAQAIRLANRFSRNAGVDNCTTAA